MENNSSEDDVTTAVGPAGADEAVPARQPPRSHVDRAREQEVLEHVRDGRREVALKILMVVYGDLLAALFARLVPDRERVKDIYQDVFLQVFRGISKVERRDDSSLWSWLCRISYHRLVDEQRRQRRSGGSMDLPDLDGFDRKPRLRRGAQQREAVRRFDQKPRLRRGAQQREAVRRFDQKPRLRRGAQQHEAVRRFDRKPRLRRGAQQREAVRRFDQILAAPESLPVIRVDDSWHDGVFQAAARLERRSLLKRWALAGGAVAAAAAALVAVAVTRPAPPPELEVVIRHNVATRGDSRQAAVGDLLVAVARPGGPADLRVYRGRDVLVARCPSGPDCAAPAGDSGEQIIEITLDAPVRYEVVLVVGAGIELPGASMDAYLDAARAANARIEIQSIAVH